MLRRFGTHGIIGMGGISPTFSVCVSGIGSAYFVDDVGGNDANDGRSAGSAWQTIAKVNGETFLPGDSIRFIRGGIWVGTLLTASSSGGSGRPIIYTDYGVGNKPLFDGNDVVNCISTNVQDYIVFQNLEVTQGIDLGFNVSLSDNITLIDCDGHDCGNEAVSLDNCSNVTILGGDYYNGYQRVALTTCAGIVIEDGANNILIDGAICRDSGANVFGISIHNHVATTYSYNVTVRNCIFTGNGSNGIYLQKADNTVDTNRNILFENCISQDNGNFGLYIFLAGTAYVDGVTFDQCNFLSNSGTREIFCRGDNLTFTQCVLDIDVARGIYASGCQNLSMLNCSIYSAAAGDFLVVVENARTVNFVMTNCIAYAPNAAVNMISVVAGTGVVGMDIDYSLWGAGVGLTRWWWLGGAFNWANWLVNSGQDINSPVPADPLFVDAANDDFHLQAGSPAIGAGIDVGFGDDIGAFQFVA